MPETHTVMALPDDVIIIRYPHHDLKVTPATGNIPGTVSFGVLLEIGPEAELVLVNFKDPNLETR